MSARFTELDRDVLADEIAEALDHHPDTRAVVNAAWAALERLTCPATAAEVEIIRAGLTMPLSAVAALLDHFRVERIDDDLPPAA